MKEIDFKLIRQALVIVAHPDDETIWLSGTMMLHPKIDWTILCLCRASDPDRAPKFFKAMKRFGAKGIIEDLDDLEKWPFQKHIKESKAQIKRHAQGRSFDLVITHGANGEYGHSDHKSVHEAVYDLTARGMLKTKAVLYLNYKKPRKKIPLLVPKADSDLIISLPEKIFKQKVKIMSEIYGFDPKGIDASYCTEKEAYKIKYYKGDF